MLMNMSLPKFDFYQGAEGINWLKSHRFSWCRHFFKGIVLPDIYIYIYIRIIFIYHRVSSTVQFTIIAKLAEFEITNIYPKSASPQMRHNTFKITWSLFLSDLFIMIYPTRNQSLEIVPLHIYRSSSIYLYIYILLYILRYIYYISTGQFLLNLG